MSKRTIEIKVTSAHIADGEPCADTNCPISLAILDKLKVSSGVSVTGTDIYIGRVNQDLELQNPRSIKAPIKHKLRKFIESFDARQHVKPIRFKLKVRKKLARKHFRSSILK